MAITNDHTYVRTEILPQQPAPSNSKGAAHWVRTNLLASPQDVIMTLVALAFIAWVVPHLVNWLFIQAVWQGTDRSFCATVAQGGTQPNDWSGACWAFVGAKFDQYIYGQYPITERWRPTIVGILFILLLVPMLIPSVPRKGLNAILLFAVLPVLSFFLLYGGFGLDYVDTPLWGGLMVTLILSYFGMAVSLPIGILLALGRRSTMPVIRTVCIMFIEVIRGVPMVLVLFMASVMLPLFLPTGWNIDKLVRALVGVAIFSSAYMAEVFRGGLQAMPKGQFEGADSLGLSYGQKMRLVILPQTIKLVIPSIVNSFIALFKDTSLVSIIGMFDLLGIVRLTFSDTNWVSPVIPMTGLVFAGFIFWLFCFGMSRYSSFMERHLDTGHKR